MKKIINIFILVTLISSFVLCAGLTAVAEQTEYFIAPQGTRMGKGTIDDPFDTLYTAIEKIKPNGTPIVINMRKGIYYMEKPAVFDVNMSGTAGAPVTIRAYGEEEVMLSGGRPVVRWTEAGDGLLKAYLPEYDFVRNLEVNGVAAVRAQMDEKIFHEGAFGIQFFKDGFIIDKNEVPEDFTGKNCELIFQYNYLEYHVKIDKCIKDSGNPQKLKLYFEKPYTGTIHYTRSSFISESTGFTIANDMSLLDREGEFYFDTDKKYLYYKPRNGETSENIEAYVAKKEVLVKVQGENSANKAGNIIFENIQFANTTWVKAEYEGFYGTQGVSYVDISNDLNTAATGYNVVSAAVQLDKAENVTFRNNIFSNLGAAALGLYDGVTGTVIEGNIFRDIGSSAITVGTGAHDNVYFSGEEGKTNIAYRKKAWASNTYPGHNALFTTDGGGNVWVSNAAYGKAILTVDLEKAYSISGIALVPRGDENYNDPGARKNFEIQASNDKYFKEYTVLGSQGATDFGLNNIWSCAVNNNEKFRYVRFYKTDDGSGEISELLVYTDEFGGIAAKEVCKDITIKNNVIARAGNDFVGSAGIHVFYSENTDISNNLLTDLPYTGITLGWGWAGSNTTCKDNKIKNNRIENISQRQYDGGGIYVLGYQPGLSIEGNVIRNARYGAGGIYPDEGTQGTRNSKITIQNNVVEDVPCWYHNWSSTTKYITTKNNYTTVPYYKDDNSDWITSLTTSLDNSYLYLKSNKPQAVINIEAAAGPQGVYTALEEKVKGLPEGNEADSSENYFAYGPHMMTDINNSHYKEYYLRGLIMTAKWYDELIKNNGITTSGVNGYTDFSSALSRAVTVYKNSSNGLNYYKEIVNASVALKNSMNALVKSGIFSGLGEMQETISSTLEKKLAP